MHADIQQMLGSTVIVEEYGEPKLDPYNPFGIPMRTGKRTRGVLEKHSEREFKVGGVVFRADHVSWTNVFIDTNGNEVETYHLHRGHRDEYEYGA